MPHVEFVGLGLDMFGLFLLFFDNNKNNFEVKLILLTGRERAIIFQTDHFYCGVHRLKLFCMLFEFRF